MKAIREIEKISLRNKKTLWERMLSLGEEYGEAVRAFNKLGRTDLEEELVDTIQVCFDILFALGLSYEQIDEILQDKNKKWKEKYVDKGL